MEAHANDGIFFMEELDTKVELNYETSIDRGGCLVNYSDVYVHNRYVFLI